MKKLLLLSIFPLMMFGVIGCGSKPAKQTLENVSEINVSSKSINNDGKLLTVTAAASNNDPAGENRNPQLEWDAVDGAECYAIIMTDSSAGNWLHWMVTDIKDTKVDEGAYVDSTAYIGPYPPAGNVHTYKISVFALKKAPSEKVGKMDAENNFDDIVKKLNTLDNNEGNIIGYGSVSGTYNHGDNTK